MAEPIDHRILMARLEQITEPTKTGKPAPSAQPPTVAPDQPSFAESLRQAAERLKAAEKQIPDPATAQNTHDIETLHKQLGALHEMTMNAHLVISQLGQQIVSPLTETGDEGGRAGEEAASL